MNRTHPTRRLLHTREVFCEAFERSDGLYDIEGRMHDITPTGTDLILKTIPAQSRLRALGAFSLHFSSGNTAMYRLARATGMTLRHACGDMHGVLALSTLRPDQACDGTFRVGTGVASP